MKHWIILSVVAILLSACVTNGPVRHNEGAEVMAPGGWYEYCKRHPADIDCGQIR